MMSNDGLAESLPKWLAPAFVVGLCTVAYTAGLVVGEQRNAVLITAVQAQMAAHMSTRVHSGAVTINEYEADQRSLVMQLERIAERLVRIEDGVTGRRE